MEKGGKVFLLLICLTIHFVLTAVDLSLSGIGIRLNCIGIMVISHLKTIPSFRFGGNQMKRGSIMNNS